MAEGGDPNTSLQEMVSDPAVEDIDGEDPLIFDTSNDPSLHGLREVSSLASWTVSTHKPHCGATALLQPTPATFWQSDGPQPHHLTLHFPKTVTIRKLRVYLDYALDESYTPTRIEFHGGVHGADYGLVRFAEWVGEEPRGWQDISVEGCGPGGSDGVRARVVQVRVMENHQNGKDTHVRGVQVFSRDERIKRLAPVNGEVDGGERFRSNGKVVAGGGRFHFEENFIGEEPDWMGEPELR